MLNAMLVNEQLQFITEKTQAKQFVIAFSGGLDSHVLLHTCNTISNSPFSFRALHINHGLQKDANNWEVHCKKICENLNISYQSQSLNLSNLDGKSLEEHARNARYQYLFDSLSDDEVLLTAHHQNDQAETILLNLFRGAGVNGLSAMPLLREVKHQGKNVFHARPLLHQPYNDLVEYAEKHKLKFIQDLSNFDEAFDRNFLRKTILPKLRKRWSGIDKTLSRAADIQAETRSLLNHYAQDDLNQILGKDNTLKISELLKHQSEKQKLLVRLWIEKQAVIMPSETKLQHLFSDVIDAQEDANPVLEWANIQIRRFKDRLYLMQKLSDHDDRQIISWDGKSNIKIESLGITIEPSKLSSGSDLLSIRFRQGGEKIYSKKRGHSISLKNLFQESEVPPWERSRIPLVYEGDDLIQVMGFENII